MKAVCLTMLVAGLALLPDCRADGGGDEDKAIDRIRELGGKGGD